MLVRELMVTAPVLTIRPDDDLALASQVMLWAAVRHLPVVGDGGAVEGVITERDVLRHEARVGGREGARSPVRAAMSSPAVAVDADAEVAEAAARMLDRGIGCLPVLHGGRLFGVLTSRDILGYQARRRLPPSASAWPAHARDVMTAPAAVQEDDDLLDAVARMVQKGVRHLPVVDGEGRVVGLLNDHDVRSALGDPTRTGLGDEGASRTVRAMKVAHAMTSRPLVARDDEPLPTIARHFLDWRVTVLPIVDEQDRLVGVISYLDLLDTVYSHFWDVPGKAALNLVR
jgi:CBS domain-containing protein